MDAQVALATASPWPSVTVIEATRFVRGTDTSCLIHPVFAGRRVLVVEDEMMIAMLVEDMLAELGCAVVGPAHALDDALASPAAKPASTPRCST